MALLDVTSDYPLRLIDLVRMGELCQTVILLDGPDFFTAHAPSQLQLQDFVRKIKARGIKIYSAFELSREKKGYVQVKFYFSG